MTIEQRVGAFVRYCLDDSIAHRAVRRKHERRRVRL